MRQAAQTTAELVSHRHHRRRRSSDTYESSLPPLLALWHFRRICIDRMLPERPLTVVQSTVVSGATLSQRPPRPRPTMLQLRRCLPHARWPSLRWSRGESGRKGCKATASQISFVLLHPDRARSATPPRDCCDHGTTGALSVRTSVQASCRARKDSAARDCRQLVGWCSMQRRQASASEGAPQEKAGAAGCEVCRSLESLCSHVKVKNLAHQPLHLSPNVWPSSCSNWHGGCKVASPGAC